MRPENLKSKRTFDDDALKKKKKSLFTESLKINCLILEFWKFSKFSKTKNYVWFKSQEKFDGLRFESLVEFYWRRNFSCQGKGAGKRRGGGMVGKGKRKKRKKFNLGSSRHKKIFFLSFWSFLCRLFRTFFRGGKKIIFSLCQRHVVTFPLQSGSSPPTFLGLIIYDLMLYSAAAVLIKNAFRAKALK